MVFNIPDNCEGHVRVKHNSTPNLQWKSDSLSTSHVTLHQERTRNGSTQRENWERIYTKRELGTDEVWNCPASYFQSQGSVGFSVWLEKSKFTKTLVELFLFSEVCQGLEHVRSFPPNFQSSSRIVGTLGRQHWSGRLPWHPPSITNSSTAWGPRTSSSWMRWKSISFLVSAICINVSSRILRMLCSWFKPANVKTTKYVESAVPMSHQCWSQSEIVRKVTKLSTSRQPTAAPKTCSYLVFLYYNLEGWEVGVGWGGDGGGLLYLTERLKCDCFLQRWKFWVTDAMKWPGPSGKRGTGGIDGHRHKLLYTLHQHRPFILSVHSSQLHWFTWFLLTYLCSKVKKKKKVKKQSPPPDSFPFHQTQTSIHASF